MHWTDAAGTCPFCNGHVTGGCLVCLRCGAQRCIDLDTTSNLRFGIGARLFVWFTMFFWIIAAIARSGAVLAFYLGGILVLGLFAFWRLPRKVEWMRDGASLLVPYRR